MFQKYPKEQTTRQSLVAQQAVLMQKMHVTPKYLLCKLNELIFFNVDKYYSDFVVLCWAINKSITQGQVVA